MKISDELREMADKFYATTKKRLIAFADRIDSEMVELPKGEDGKPIHCMEELWVDCADCYEKRCLLLMRLESDGRWALVFEGGTMCDPSIVAHEEPDSLERISQELEDMSENFRATDKDSFSALLDFADRIRKLADKEG